MSGTKCTDINKRTLYSKESIAYWRPEYNGKVLMHKERTVIDLGSSADIFSRIRERKEKNLALEIVTHGPGFILYLKWGREDKYKNKHLK